MTDLIPTPRPVESREDRMRHATAAPYAAGDAAPQQSFATYLDASERDQLDGRAATAEQERDDALDDRDQARADLAGMTELRDEALGREANLRSQLHRTNRDRQRLQEQLDDMARQRDEALEARDVLRHRERLFTDAIRGVVEQLDRALAAWETQQQEQPTLKHLSVLGNCIACGSRCPNGTCPNDTPSPGLGSPADRAQDDLSWRRLDPAPIDSEPMRCRTRYADPTGLPHRCFLTRGHTSVHEWKTERP